MFIQLFLIQRKVNGDQWLSSSLKIKKSFNWLSSEVIQDFWEETQVHCGSYNCISAFWNIHIWIWCITVIWHKWHQTWRLKDLRAAAQEFLNFLSWNISQRKHHPQTLKYQRPERLHETFLSVHQQRLLQPFKSIDPNPHVHWAHIIPPTPTNQTMWPHYIPPPSFSMKDKADTHEGIKGQ